MKLWIETFSWTEKVSPLEGVEYKIYIIPLYFTIINDWHDMSSPHNP